MPGAGLRAESQEGTGGARDCGEVRAKQGDELVTGERENASLPSIAGQGSSGAVGRTKCPAWLRQNGQCVGSIASSPLEPPVVTRSGWTCTRADVQISAQDVDCCRDEAKACETLGARVASRTAQVAIHAVTSLGRWSGFNSGAADGSATPAA